VIVNAPSDKVVTLRGLSINGACNGIRGINFIQGKTLNVEDCVIFRFANEGILVNDSDGMALNVRNSVIRDNAGDGISTTTAAAAGVRVTLDNVRLSGDSNGLHAKSGSRVTARNCVFSNNTSHGIFVDAAGTNFSAVSVWSSQISLNGSNGVQAGNAGNLGGSAAQIAQNQIDRNVGFGVNIGTGGIVNTFTNNSILGNGTDGCAGCANSAPGN
jgi:hypothetical protein